MKKTLLYVGLWSLILSNMGFARAQTSSSTLPNPGFTPDSPFYLFDHLVENLQRFFTFNPVSKAKLEIKFAAERLAEIKLMLDVNGVKDRGIEIAQSELNNDLSRAANIIVAQKSKGEDVSELAKSLGDEVDRDNEALNKVFEDQKNSLKTKEKELENKLESASSTRDMEKVGEISSELKDLRDEKEELDKRSDKIDKNIESGAEGLNEGRGDKESAAHILASARRDRDRLVARAQKDGVAVAADVLKSIDNLLSQAKSAFDAGNFGQAKILVKQAKKAMGDAKENIRKENDNGNIGREGVGSKEEGGKLKVGRNSDGRKMNSTSTMKGGEEMEQGKPNGGE